MAITENDTANTLAALGAAAIDPRRVDGTRWIVLPPGYKAQDISDEVEKAQPEPGRKRGAIRLAEIGSLIAYAKDQAAQATGYLYAHVDSRTITAVFNDQKSMQPGWRDHRATFTAEFTPEAARWIGANAKPFGQTEFAEFIEDNLADLHGAEATTLLTVATTIAATSGINFASAKRLQDGQTQLTYTEQIDAKAGANGEVRIPQRFTLGLRLFKGDAAGYALAARLKYRLHGGAVKFWYELERPERAIEDAFLGYVKRAAEESGYTVLAGVAG